MGFKMKKPSIIKGTAAHKKAVKDYQELQVNRNMEQNMPDGRSMSSPFQKNDSPTKKTTDARPPTPEERKSRKQKVVEMHEEHKGKPGWQEHVDKTFGVKTTIEGGVSTTRKQKEDPSPAKQAEPQNPQKPATRKFAAKKLTAKQKKEMLEKYKAKASPAKGIFDSPQHSKTRDRIKNIKRKVGDAVTHIKARTKELFRDAGADNFKYPGRKGREAVQKKQGKHHTQLTPSKKPQTPPKTAKEKSAIIAKMNKKNSPNKLMGLVKKKVNKELDTPAGKMAAKAATGGMA